MSEGEDHEDVSSGSLTHLKHPWMFWFYKPKAGIHGEDAFFLALQKVGESFNTVEGFTSYFANLPKVTELDTRQCFHMMRDSAQPTWEDELNKLGGQWVWKVPKTSSDEFDADTVWRLLLFGAIGEQFTEADEICGISAKGLFKAANQVQFSIWHRQSSNSESVKARILEYLKENNIPESTLSTMELEYHLHAQKTASGS